MLSNSRWRILAKIVLGYSCVVVSNPVAQSPRLRAEEFPFDVSFTQFGEAVTIPFHMWLPDDMPTVRGLVFESVAGCGASHAQAKNPRIQRLAHALGFGLVGQGSLSRTQGCWFGETRAETEQFLQSALDAAAAASGHPELVNAPVALTGHSWGGHNSHLIATRVPSRVVGFAGRRGFVIDRTSPYLDAGEGAAQVPGIFILGTEDEVSLLRADVQQPDFDDWRGQNAHVAFAAEWSKVHADTMQTQDMAWYWLSEVIRLRYPEGQFPSTTPGEPMILNDIDTNAGWLGETPRFSPEFHASAAPEIFPVTSYPGDAGTASWLPSEGAANVYRAVTAIADRQYVPGDQIYPGPMRFASPSYMQYMQSPVTYHAGDHIPIQIDPFLFDDEHTITEMTFFAGDQVIGTDTEGPDWRMFHRLDDVGIHGLTVVATNELGAQTFAFRAVAVLPATGTRTVPPHAIYSVADSDRGPTFDGLGDGVEDVLSDNARRRVGEQDTASTNQMMRLVTKFLLPAPAPKFPELDRATLRFFIETIDGPLPGSLAVLHGAADNDLDLLASDYENTDYVDTTLNLALATDLSGRYYELDVTDLVRADYAADGDNPLSAFRLQVRNAVFSEDDQGFRYVVSLPGAETNHPELVLTFIPEPSTLTLTTITLGLLWCQRKRR